MEDKLIIEGNELLAKFMNVSIVQSKTSMAKFYHSDEFTLVNGKLAFAYNLKFDKDWNWLHELIDKINKIVIKFDSIIDEDLIKKNEFEVCYENGLQGIRIVVFEFRMAKELPIYKIFNADLEDSHSNRLIRGRFLTDKEKTFITIVKFLKWYNGKDR